MTDQPHPSGDRPAYAPAPPPPRRRSRPLFWLLALLLAAAAGYGGWRAWQWAAGTIGAVSTQQELLARQARDLAALRAQMEEMASRQTDLSAAVRRNGADIANLDGRIEDGQEAMARLSETVEGGRTRLQLAAVEQLLLMANDRLLLAHDSASALKALDLADQRLAVLNDPRLFRIREALAQERAALAMLALPDHAGITLALAEVSRRLPDLPLRARVRDRFDAETAATAPPEETGALERLWRAVRTALSSMFTLRRTEGPKPRLLAPEAEALVAQVLQLKLDGARLALLAGDTRTFRELAGEGGAWLARYYDETDPGVRAAQAELQRVGALQLAPDLPDISRSLTLLRAHLGAAPR
jgi:uroporphyrin-III C-methyltransferase